ncbi:MAG: glycosyltransferase [Candidatus Nanopelagicales bacterium]
MKAQIVLATHNPRPDLLERQLRSLIDQTESNWQCLVLDDASSDRSAIASVLGDRRFTLLPPREHLGPYRAFEHLLQSAARVPVFLCDQDDYWHPEKVALMLAVPGTAFSAMRVVDEQGHWSVTGSCHRPRT